MAKAKETTQAVDSSALSNGNNPREKGLSHSNVSAQTQVSAANQSKTEANVNVQMKSNRNNIENRKSNGNSWTVCRKNPSPDFQGLFFPGFPRLAHRPVVSGCGVNENLRGRVTAEREGGKTHETHQGSAQLTNTSFHVTCSVGKYTSYIWRKM